MYCCDYCKIELCSNYSLKRHQESERCKSNKEKYDKEQLEKKIIQDKEKLELLQIPVYKYQIDMLKNEYKERTNEYKERIKNLEKIIENTHNILLKKATAPKIINNKINNKIINNNQIVIINPSFIMDLSKKK
jgi:hypothetical protein